MLKRSPVATRPGGVRSRNPNWVQAMNFIDEEDLSRIEIRQDCR
jgi:hypothetical protein